MRKVIAAINMTIDGYCDHTKMDPDEEIHLHYEQLLNQGDAILYGRTTYQLMEFWKTFLEEPSPEKSLNDFAESMDKIPKIVFSKTLKNVDWKTAILAADTLENTVIELKQTQGRNIFVGSRSLILQLIKLNLIDEFQLCIHPIIAGGGLPLFENSDERKKLKFMKTKKFTSGAIVVYYDMIN
jgi:dihydrofolate reductase